MTSRALRILKAASFGTRTLPLSVLVPLAEWFGAAVGPLVMADKAAMLDRHLMRVAVDTEPAGEAPPPSESKDGFGSYARYWIESFRLPSLNDRQIDRGFSFVGYEHIEAVRAKGFAPILVLPHLGGWEWAAAWLGRVAEVEVTAVVEELEPRDVFDWFEELRSSWGVNVVPLGSSAFGRLTKAAKERHIICLLADRDVGGTGIDVTFFGETTKLPVGPAVLSSRTGSPLLPTAVYFSGQQRLCRVGQPIWPNEAAMIVASQNPISERAPAKLRPRDRYRAVTQQLAAELERLIADAPDQWHLLEPNWPSDLKPAD